MQKKIVDLYNIFKNHKIVTILIITNTTFNMNNYHDLFCC